MKIIKDMVYAHTSYNHDCNCFAAFQRLELQKTAVSRGEVSGTQPPRGWRQTPQTLRLCVKSSLFRSRWFVVNLFSIYVFEREKDSKLA
jgi:hypothetical protein